MIYILAIISCSILSWFGFAVMNGEYNIYAWEEIDAIGWSIACIVGSTYICTTISYLQDIRGYKDGFTKIYHTPPKFPIYIELFCYILTLPLLLYIIFGFISQNWNIMEWTEVMRGVWCIGLLFSAMIAPMVCIEKD